MLGGIKGLTVVSVSGSTLRPARGLFTASFSIELRRMGAGLDQDQRVSALAVHQN